MLKSVGEQSALENRSPSVSKRAAMSAPTKSILIAIIGALSSIGTAWVTANGVAANKTTETISASGSEIAELRRQIDETAKKAEDARLAAEQALAPCPPLSAANLGSARTFLKTNEGRTPAVVELLALNGSGCLVSGAILGFYFQRLQGDTSYSIQIEVDGQTHKYPAADRAVAYAADNKKDNTGVLPLPTLRYSRSLRITYYYPGGPASRVNAYAVVIPQ